MSSIYDNRDNIERLDGGLSASSRKVSSSRSVQAQVNYDLNKTTGKTSNDMELIAYQNRSANALRLVDDIVLKKYLTRLSGMDVISAEDIKLSTDNIILFKINKMVYEKDEYATDKFISVVSAMTYTEGSIYLIVDGHKGHTDFYLGIKCEDKERQMSSVAETFKDAILGQFPGAILEDYSYRGRNGEASKQEKLLHRISEAASISSCVGIPAYKNSKGEYTNANFIQGIEKFALAMQGKEYTAVILASNISREEINNIRNGYENVYTELSAMSTKQLAYSTNESLANAISRTKGYSDTINESKTIGSSDSESETKTHSEGTSETTTKTKGSTRENFVSKLSKIAGPVMQAGMILAGVATGGVAVPIMIGAGATLNLVGGKQLSESESNATGKTISDSTASSHTYSTNQSHTEGTSHSENFSETDGETSSIGSSKNITITIQNKHILEIQKRIDKQLERLELCESTGLWSTGAYFLSYTTDRATAEIGATLFRSIIQGEQSGVENSAINTWYPESRNNFPAILKYVGALTHPVFIYKDLSFGTTMHMLPTSLISSKELAIMIGLPRKSVPGLPVVEHISLAKEVVRLNENTSRGRLKLGCIYDQGVERRENPVNLDTKSLTQHVFVTGSTGCGKSNTIYYLIKQIRNQINTPKFLVIEPAKGEYKDVFGNEHIYGTNPLRTPLLKINPFRFPEGVHVLEHIDRLIEIFNVCWPMYAAMPAVLKEAILNSYEDCGWDLFSSKNSLSNTLFPTFADLLNELVTVINSSAYSEEVKSNYQGSLVTRIKSLNNGICKQIFSGNELGDHALFDENVIVDISRIGSQETKSLIMGILIMRLNEYRANNNIPHNSDLRHITILEEAHNILKRCSQEQTSEGSNVAGKSVEMISNSIAEMRTYGEGFIIVDQSPGAVDISAIRNTNTKIIMRLPEDNDRKVAGKASGMKDNQIDEIAKLPTGVAVVYQNDWEEPVLCKIGKFDEPEIPFEYIPKDHNDSPASLNILNILKFLLKGRIRSSIDTDIDTIEASLDSSDLSTSNKVLIYEALSEFKKSGESHLWKDCYFDKLSRLVSQILAAKTDVKRITRVTSSFDELTQRLGSFISDKVDGLSEELTLATAQCLMKDYSLDGDIEKRVYSAWFQNIKNADII